MSDGNFPNNQYRPQGPYPAQGQGQSPYGGGQFPQGGQRPPGPWQFPQGGQRPPGPGQFPQGGQRPPGQGQFPQGGQRPPGQGHPQPPRYPRPKGKAKWLPWVLGGVGSLALISVIGIFEQSPSTAPAGITSSTASKPAARADVPSTQAPTTQASITQAPPPPPTTQAPPRAPEPVMEVTAQKMIDDLESNALKAKNTYSGKRVAVTGYVGTIDASGKYFVVDPEPDAFILAGVTADVRSDQHRSALAEVSQNDKMTVTGKVTDVGEILGYRIAVESMT